MKVVILGAGNRGFQIARHLIEEKNEVVVIEPDRETADLASSKLDCMVINGSGTSLATLKEAGTAGADVFIGISESDEVNLVSCGLVGSEFRVPNKVASIRNLTYMDFTDQTNAVLGIEHIVNPEVEAARSIFETLEQGAVSEAITFEKTDFVFHNIVIDDDSRFVGKHVKTIRRYMSQYSFLITSINRDGEVFIPTGDTVILAEDVLSVVSEEKGIDRIFRSLGKEKKKIKKIMIVGGSKAAWFLMKHFTKAERSRFTLVDKDPETCKTFASQYPEMLIIKSDISDEGLYEDLDLVAYDIILTLTGNDELNIVSAIYAKRLGIDRSLVLIRNNSYLRLISQLEIDSAISVTRATVNSVLRYVRGSGYTSFKSVFDGQVEIYEFTLPESSRLVGKKVKEVDLKGHGLIAAITRKKKNLIPTGETVLMAEDALVLTAQRNSLGHVQKLFSQ